VTFWKVENNVDKTTQCRTMTSVKDGYQSARSWWKEHLIKTPEREDLLGSYLHKQMQKKAVPL